MKQFHFELQSSLVPPETWKVFEGVEGQFLEDTKFRIQQDETIKQMIHIYHYQDGRMDNATDFGDGVIINDFGWSTDIVNAFFKWRNNQT